MEISLTIKGLPPAKDGATSIFNKQHRHHIRVVDLLRMAKHPLDNSQWNRTENRDIGLELVMTDTLAGLPGDAINYLGGVSDVLQVDRRNVYLAHLGDLAHATLYYNDNQIR